MNSKSTRFFLIICIFLIGFLVVAWLYRSYKMPPELNIQENELTDEHGVTVKVADFRGKYVFLNYFQTWCGDCIQELESINNLQTKAGKEKLQILLISDEPWEKIKRFKEKHGNTFSFYQSIKTFKSQNIRVFPTSFLLDKNGNVLISKINAFEWDSMEVIQLIK